ncbi:hypothetical protein N9378_00420 [Flavobacteriaceae bacterium]|nr:hypothetical protein [Flavobacteriaceae bacterium]
MPKFLSDVDIEAPTLTITNADGGGAYQPIVTIESTNSTTGNEPLLRFYKNSTGSSGEDMGTIEFLGKDNGGTDATYGSVRCQATSSASEGYDGTIADSERGEIMMLAASGANSYNVIKGTGASTHGVIDVYIGQNAASMTTIAGDLDIDGDNMTTAGAMTLTTGGAYEIASGGDMTLDSAGNINCETDGEFNITSSDLSNKPLMVLESTSTDAAGYPSMTFFKNSSSEAGEKLGAVNWKGRDSGDLSESFCSIEGEIVSNTNTTELGKMVLNVRNGSNYPNGLTISASGSVAAQVDVTIGNTTSSTSTIAGNLAVTNKITECKRKFSPTGSNTAGTNSGGDIVYIGSGSTVLGEIVHYKSDGTWEAADATDVTKCDGLLGVALGTDPDVNGVLLRGMVTIADIDGTEAVGMPLFLSEDATGHANMAAPEGDNQVVRIIGYCLHATNGEIWFNPDNTFVEVSA